MSGSFGDFVLNNPITSFVAIFAVVLALLAGYFFLLHKDNSDASASGGELFKGISKDAGADLGDDWTDLDFRSQSGTDPGGLAPSQDIVSGQTDRYSWAQSNQEVDVFVPVSETVKKKDIVCNITGFHLNLTVAGVEIINGALFAEIDPSECNWQLGE
jgi:hypothetical protein